MVKTIRIECINLDLVGKGLTIYLLFQLERQSMSFQNRQSHKAFSNSDDNQVERSAATWRQSVHKKRSFTNAVWGRWLNIIKQEIKFKNSMYADLRKYYKIWTIHFIDQLSWNQYIICIMCLWSVNTLFHLIILPMSQTNIYIPVQYAFVRQYFAYMNVYILKQMFLQCVYFFK